MGCMLIVSDIVKVWILVCVIGFWGKNFVVWVLFRYFRMVKD